MDESSGTLPVPKRRVFLTPMRVTVVAPSPSLAPFVRRFEVVETSEASTRTLLPEPGLVLGIRFGGRAALLGGGRPEALPQSSVTGLRTTVRQMRTSAGGGIVVVKFRPAGAALFFDSPLHEVFGAIRPLTDWVPARDVDRLESRLAEAKDHATRIALVEAFLLERMGKRRSDGLVAAALREIQSAPDSIRIGALADALDVSLDLLEKRFRRIVGCSPKQFSTILRLRGAVERHRQGMSLTQLSLEAGFYDQAHFIRHFRSMAGVSPRRFLEGGAYC